MVGRAADSLDESRVGSDPFNQFRRWLREAAGRRSSLPETMTLATATRSGRPSARTLLLRTFDDSGFVFYTSYSGRKGMELAENPQAALVFYWPGYADRFGWKGEWSRFHRENLTVISAVVHGTVNC